MLTAALLASVFGLALLDSLNPSALLATLYFLGNPSYTKKILTYVCGIFLTSLAFGVVVLLGLDAVLNSFEDVLYSPTAYAIQGVIGAIMLAYALFAPTKDEIDDPAENSRLRPQSQGLGAIFLLGITVTGIELSTAFPYFAAIGLLTSASLSMSEWLPILVGYNLIFITPPILLVIIYRLAGDRFERRFPTLRNRLQREARETFLWLIGIVGFFLASDSLRYFLNG